MLHAWDIEMVSLLVKLPNSDVFTELNQIVSSASAHAYVDISTVNSCASYTQKLLRDRLWRPSKPLDI